MSSSAPPPHHKAAPVNLKSLAPPHTRVFAKGETAVDMEVRVDIIGERGP